MKLHKIEKGRYSLMNNAYNKGVRLEVSRSYNFGLGWRYEREECHRQISLYCWRLFSIWITLENHNWKYVPEPIQTGIVWQSKEHVLYIQLHDTSSMDSSKPAWFRKYWNYRDWLFGRPIYSESHHRDSMLGQPRQKYYMTMPEGKYEMKMDFFTSYWHRPRSPFVKAIERVEITPERPVPTPGKGENSYDLDEDATFSSTMPVNNRTPQQLVEDFKQSTLERRERYGGKKWKPEKVWEKQF